MSDLVQRLVAMLAAGQEGAMLRFGLGQALLKDGRAEEAARHLAEAVAHDASYSAAWKLLGRARAEAGDAEGAASALREGIAAADAAGDKQAAKEMQVFLRRLERSRG